MWVIHHYIGNRYCGLGEQWGFSSEAAAKARADHLKAQLMAGSDWRYEVARMPVYDLDQVQDFNTRAW